MARGTVYPGLLLALTLSSLCGLSALRIAEAAEKDSSPARFQSLDRAFQHLVRHGDIAGAVIGIQQHGHLLHKTIVGAQDIASRTPMREDSIFRIYSMTKAFTGVAMMQLYEEGRWSLEDPVAKFIPEFADLKVASGDDAEGNLILRSQTHPMTMRELMTHTAGFTYAYYNQTKVEKMYDAVNLEDPHQTLQQLIDKLAKLPLNSQPGEKWHYSIAADVQGYIIEKLTGKSLADYLQERVFAPLQMIDSGFHVPEKNWARLATGYVYADGHRLVPFAQDQPDHDFRYPPHYDSGGNGAVTTVKDFLRFEQMLLNGGVLDGTRVLHWSSVDLMMRNNLPPVVRETDPGKAWGLGFAVITDAKLAKVPYANGTVYWNGAAGTWFWIDRRNDLAVIGLVQQWSQPDAPDFFDESNRPIYKALTDERRAR
jgi:CubicO group peptidase (beta-lactamase class C family)